VIIDSVGRFATAIRSLVGVLLGAPGCWSGGQRWITGWPTGSDNWVVRRRGL